MYDYEEACPISKAASVLCERWTLQIIREMLLGATRFSEFQKYLPKMSPTLLNSRLKNLEKQGIILRKRTPEKKGYEYRLTPAGQALQPVLMEFGKWGMNWAFASMDEKELNASAIVRDFAVALDTNQLPSGDTNIQFNISAEEELKKFILVRNGCAQVCDENIGNEVDVYLTSTLSTLGNIWYGKLPIATALDTGQLKVVGASYLTSTISKWLHVSQFSNFDFLAKETTQ